MKRRACGVSVTCSNSRGLRVLLGFVVFDSEAFVMYAAEPYGPQHFLSSDMFVVCTGCPLTMILLTLVTSPPPWLSSTKMEMTRTF